MIKKVLLAAGLLLALAGTAQAGIMFTAGNNPEPNEENILFGAKYTGVTSITGHTNGSGVGVDFYTLPGGNTSIGTNGIGQADIVCTGGCGTYSKGGANGAQLTALGIRVEDGWAFHDFIGNLRFGEGTAKITVTDGGGTDFDFLLGNGQNFFTLVSDGSDVMTNILITEFAGNDKGYWGFNDFKQPRISGLCELGAENCGVVINPNCTDNCPIDVPESPTLPLMAAGLMGLGLVVARRKKGLNSVTA